MKPFSKSYLVSFTIVTLVILMVIHPALFFFNYGYRNAYERYLNEWFEIKNNYAADHTDENLILVLSGSNTLFGVDAEKMETELNTPVLNGGSHAAMHEYIFYWAKQVLKPGDTVVMPLEYELYESNQYGPDYLRYINGYATNYFEQMSGIQKLSVIYRMSPELLLNLTKFKLNPPLPWEDGFSSKYLNLHGDMTNNAYENRTSSSVLVTMVKDQVFKSKKDISIESKREISDFVAFCKNNDIKVYATWPNYLYSDVEFHDGDLQMIEQIKSFYQSLEVPVLGDYTDCLYPADLFYDTIYHLNDKGKEIHTEYLIELLRQVGA